jgi:hypothetical protein
MESKIEARVSRRRALRNARELVLILWGTQVTAVTVGT